MDPVLFDREYEQAVRFISQYIPDTNDLGYPALLHSLRVGMSLYVNGYMREVCLAGLLHDIFEITNLTRDEIVQNFGEEVTAIVEANTTQSDLQGEEQSNEMISRVVQSREACVVRAATLIDTITYFLDSDDEAASQRLLLEANNLLNTKPQDLDDEVFTTLADGVQMIVSRQTEIAE